MQKRTRGLMLRRCFKIVCFLHYSIQCGPFMTISVQTRENVLLPPNNLPSGIFGIGFRNFINVDLPYQISFFCWFFSFLFPDSRYAPCNPYFGWKYNAFSLSVVPWTGRDWNLFNNSCVVEAMEYKSSIYHMVPSPQLHSISNLKKNHIIYMHLSIL